MVARSVLHRPGRSVLLLRQEHPKRAFIQVRGQIFAARTPRLICIFLLIHISTRGPGGGASIRWRGR